MYGIFKLFAAFPPAEETKQTPVSFPKFSCPILTSGQIIGTQGTPVNQGIAIVLLIVWSLTGFPIFLHVCTERRGDPADSGNYFKQAWNICWAQIHQETPHISRGDRSGFSHFIV